MTSHYSSNEESRVLDEATLVDQLNTLLSSLNIPITLISPTDLTPTLLIAILESVLNMRIPLIDRSQTSKYSKGSKIQNMKIFLGFLELDVLKADVGLSDVDPRRLAEGELEEVTFVAELLCWMGRRKGLIRKPDKHEEEAITSRRAQHSIPPNSVKPLSPKSQLDLDAISLFQTASSATGSTRPSTLFSPFVKNMDKESTSTLDTTGKHEAENESYDAYSDDVSDVLGALPLFTKHQPQCIHEIPSPSLLFSQDFDLPSTTTPSHLRHDPPPQSNRDHDLEINFNSSFTASKNDRFENDYSADRSQTSVRYTGFIEQVDEESELASFEHSRSISYKENSVSFRKSQRSVKIETIKQQYARTRELLNERARLLSQLADLKLSHG